MRLTQRTQQLLPSPITEAHSWLAQRTSERELIDLSQAAPTYGPPDAVARRVAEVASELDGSKYCPTTGLPSLTNAFASELGRDYAATLQPENVLPTSGCNQAFCVATSTIAEPGDEVILPVPYYFNHDMWLKLDGLVPRYAPVDSHFVPDPAVVERLITPKTRAIVLVSPGNPTGVTIPAAVLNNFFDLARSAGLALIIDETYRNFRPTTDRPHNLFHRAGWEETAVFLHSFSKDLAIPGYRVGALVAGPAFLEEAMKILDCMQISAPRIGQEAVVAGLLHSGDWRARQASRILDSLGHFQTAMAPNPGGFSLACSGAFFGWVRHPFPQLPSSEVVRRLVLDHDVLVIAGTAFTPTDDQWLRFSYANLEPSQFGELALRLREMATATSS